MELLKPSIEVEKYDGIEIMKRIERAMRTCYKSEGLQNEDSYKKLLDMAIKSGHESVLEHEKITVRINCSINFYKDITRHRTGVAFSIESTRWCNYSKDKYNNSIKFMDPVYITDKNNYEIWKNTMQLIEDAYMQMGKNGARADEMRTMLPHSTAATVVMTCNIREWRHILSLRTSDKVHPEIRQILIPLLLKFKKDMKELFDDIPYDTNFPTEWYADVNTLEDV